MAPLDQGKGVWKSGKGKGRHLPKGRQYTDDALADIKVLLRDYVVSRDPVSYTHLTLPTKA